MPGRVDPFTSHNFQVALGDGSEDQVTGFFREVSGLGMEIEVIEYRLGGDRLNAVRKLPGLRKFSNVTLKRGLLGDLRLWQWISAEPPERRNVVITLLDAQMAPRMRFVLHDAFPVKWEGPDLNASSSEVAIETLELAHEGLEVSAD